VFNPFRDRPGREKTGRKRIMRITKDYIDNLKIGSLAPNCFGKLSPITSITASGTSVHGNRYIFYYTQFGYGNGAISHSLLENEYVYTISGKKGIEEITELQ